MELNDCISRVVAVPIQYSLKLARSERRLKMLNMYRAILILAFFLAGQGGSWAQSKPPSAVIEYVQPVESVKPDQRGTESQPLTVIVVPTAEQQAAAEKIEAEARLKAAADRKLLEYTGDQVLIGIVTFFIFLLQLVAFTAQAIYMRRSTTEMRRTTHATIRAARAATKSANVAEAALIVAERPYLVPNQPKLALYRYGEPGMPPSNPAVWVGTIDYGFVNMGRSVAFLKQVTVEIVFTEKIPTAPKYTPEVTYIGHFPIGINVPYECPRYPIQKIDAARFSQIESGTLKAFFFGYVRYADIFGHLHTDGFCFHFHKLGLNQQKSECAVVGGRSFNYTRTETIPPEGVSVLAPQGGELSADEITRHAAKSGTIVEFN